MEAVRRLHPIGHDLQRMLEHLCAFPGRRTTFAGIVPLGVHTGQRSRGQTHEFCGMLRIRSPLITQTLGHTRNQELHDAVRTVGTMTHEVQCPTDHAPITPCGQPAGDAQHTPIRIDGIQKTHARVTQFLDTAQRKLHLRQSLELRPFLGDVLNLLTHFQRRFQERGLHIGDAVALGFVDGGTHVLPFLAGGLPPTRVHNHFTTDLNRVPSLSQQRITLLAMHTVEHRRPRPFHAILRESGQIVHPLRRIAKWPSAGQCNTVEYTVCHSRFARGRQPIVVAFPRGHEAHRFAAGLNQPFGTGLRPLIRLTDVAHPTHHHGQHHDPEHQADALIHHGRQWRTRHERQLHMAQEPDGQEPSRQFGQQRRRRGPRRKRVRLGDAVHKVHGGAGQ